MQTNNNEIKHWRYTYIAGHIPLVAGILTLLTTWWSIFNDTSNWWLGAGSLDFTFKQIIELSNSSAPFLTLLGSVGSVNIVLGAIAVMVISKQALRNGQKWAWYFLLFSFIWVGLHDAWSATVFFVHTKQPLLILPFTYCFLMLIGLFKTKNQIFNPQ